MRHPGQIPDKYKSRSARGRGWDIDWGGMIGWTGRALNTGRCVGYAYTPVGWFGCDDIPDRAQNGRSLVMDCGAKMAILGGILRSGVAVFAGGSTCAYDTIKEW